MVFNPHTRKAPSLYIDPIGLIKAFPLQTSNSMQFALHLLARNPEIQRQLHDEVSSEVPSEDILPSHLHHLPYLKGFVKEVLRQVYHIRVQAANIQRS